MGTTGFTRRGFLRFSAGAAAVAALPLLGRSAGGAPGALARARRLLVLNFAGGIRSSASFLASPVVRLNPYGLIAGTGGPFALGRVLDDSLDGAEPVADASYVLGPAWHGARVPRFREVADRFSVLGTWSEQRGYHARARLEEPSGDPTGVAPGLLTRVASGMAKLGGETAIPAFHLTPRSKFGGGQGALARYVPVELETWKNLPSTGDADPAADIASGHDWVADEAMRDRFDRPRVASRAGHGKMLTDTAAVHRRGGRIIGARLALPDLAVGENDHADAALGTVRLDGVGPVPLTNAMLAELFLGCMSPGTFPRKDDALDAALAVRLLQLGSPAVTLEVTNFDFHSGERTLAPPLYSYTGRLWAALSWLLPRIDDPSGEGSLLDRTLVTTMSDFGRDAGGPSGYNGGEGCDHGNDPACFYLAHAMMGAGIPGGKLINGVRTDTFDARGNTNLVTPPQLLATLLDALGLDGSDEDYGLPGAGRTIGELWS